MKNTKPTYWNFSDAPDDLAIQVIVKHEGFKSVHYVHTTHGEMVATQDNLTTAMKEMGRRKFKGWKKAFKKDLLKQDKRLNLKQETLNNGQIYHSDEQNTFNTDTLILVCSDAVMGNIAGLSIIEENDLMGRFPQINLN